MKIIRIQEFNENKVLAWDLIDVLSICGEAYKDRVWIAFGVDCVDTPWYRRLTEAPNHQLEMTYEELLDYAEGVHQTYDGVFFALHKRMKYDGKKIEYKNIKEISDFIIDIVDGGFIEVTTDNKKCIKRIKSKLSKGFFISRRKK